MQPRFEESLPALLHLGEPLRHRIEPLIGTPACQVAFRQHTKTVEPTDRCETTHLADALLGSSLNGQRPATDKSSKHQMRRHTVFGANRKLFLGSLQDLRRVAK